MREPITIVEIDRDICSRVYGVGLCTATGSPCYNTWHTCQVKPVFSATTQVMRFVKPRADVPMSLDAIPSVRSTSTSPTELNVGDVDASSGPLGKRAQATVTFEDHPYSDALTDPYVVTRSINPFQNGTFWTKLKARWPIAKGRALRIRDGYLGQDPEDMVSREYLIDAIDGPNSNGIVTVRAVDPLRLLDDKTSQAPKQSTGYLAADINNSQQDISVISGSPQSYPSTGTLRIEAELMTYTAMKPVAAGSSVAWNFTTDAEGWTASGLSQSVSGGVIYLTSTSGDPVWVSPAISLDGSTNRYVNVRIKRTAGSSWQGTLFYATAGHGFSESYKKTISDSTIANEWVDLTFDMHDLTAGGGDWEGGTITQIRFDFGVAVGDNFTVDWVLAGEYSSLTFSGITRATDGSAAKEHKAESRVQTCVRYTNQNAWEVAKSLIEVYAPSAYGYIDQTQWATEAAQWLDGFIVSGLISEPTGLNTLLAELCRDAQFFIWWDERLQKILLRAVRPPTETPVQFNEDANILAGSQSIKTAPNERVSQLWYYYEPADLSKKVDAEDNYRKVRIRIDAESESEREYDESAVKKIYSRWVRTDAIVIAITTRILARYRDDPLYLTISVDAKDRNTWTADVVDVSSRLQTNTEGLPLTRRYQVISAQEVQPGAVIKYVLQTYDFTAKYAYWMASDAPIFSLATAEQKALGAWWSDSDGLIDGESGYEWQ